MSEDELILQILEKELKAVMQRVTELETAIMQQKASMKKKAAEQKMHPTLGESSASESESKPATSG